MIMIKLILMAAAVLAIVVGTISNIQEAQAAPESKNIRNHHDHSDGLKGNDGTVANCSGDLCFDDTGAQTDQYHSNTNDNTNRPYDGDCCSDRVRTNNHEIPNG